MRGWSYEHDEEVFTGSTGTRGAAEEKSYLIKSSFQEWSQITTGANPKHPPEQTQTDGYVASSALWGITPAVENKAIRR